MHALLMILVLKISLPRAEALVPRLYLTTEGERPIDSKDEDLDARLRIDDATELRAHVRGRGNSTWFMPKRPFSLRLDEPFPLLGLRRHRHWILLANFADKTLLRNLLGNFMGARLSFAFTPQDRPVLLNLNGADLGAYVLSETVTSSSETGDVLLEVDARRDQAQTFETSRGVPYAILRPKSPEPAAAESISSYVREIEDVLDAAPPPSRYEELIDVESFVDAFLVNEIMKNSDAANFSSIFLNKKVGRKLAMGPLWDFDLAAGNIDYTEAANPTGWWIRTHSPWYRALFTDPRFEARVRARWAELGRLGLALDDLKRFIDRTAETLREAQRENFALWPILDLYVWPNAVVTGSYAGEIDYLKSWLTVRMRWLDMQLR